MASPNEGNGNCKGQARVRILSMNQKEKLSELTQGAATESSKEALVAIVQNYSSYLEQV